MIDPLLLAREQDALPQNRIRGERWICLFRLSVAVGGGISALILAGAGVRLPFPWPALAGWLSAAVLFSLAHLLIIKKWGYLRAMGLLASFLDILLVTMTHNRLLLNGALLFYLLLILLSIRRCDPANTLFTGLLAGAAFLFLVLTGDPRRLHEGLILVLLFPLVGGFGYTVTRNASRQMAKTTEAEEALHREQIHLQRLFESTPEAVVLLTQNSEVIRPNKAFLQLFGYKEEEVLGRSIDELIIPPNLLEEARDLTLRTSLGNRISAETVRRRKDGTLVDVSILGTPVFVRGRQKGIFGIYRNISDRKRKERLFQTLNRAALSMQQAMSQEAVFAAVADSLGLLGLSCLLLLLEADGAGLHIAEARLDPGHATREAGKRQIDFKAGDPYHRVIHERKALFFAEGGPAPLFSEPFPSITAPLFEDEKVFGLLEVIGPDLTEKDIPAINTFCHQMAASWRRVILVRQIEGNLSELKQVQEQLVQSQKMEAVGRLAGGIAHDFNNLLTVINGYAELALESLPAGNLARVELQEILRAGEQAARMTKHLLAFSRKQMLKLEILDMNLIVEKMRTTLLKLIGEDIELKTRITEPLMRIYADPVQIEQAILNIAINARDAMPKGGTFSLTTANCTPDRSFYERHPEVVEGPYVLISLEDTGPGIPSEALSHIFDPFFTTKERDRGTGMGLSMVYGFVKQSSGYVYAESPPGKGARFDIYLPAHPTYPH